MKYVIRYATFLLAAACVHQAAAQVTFSTFTPANSPGFVGVAVNASIDGVQIVTSYDVEFTGTFQQYNGSASPNSFTDIGDFDAGGFDADPRTTLGDDTHFLVDHSLTTLALTDSETTSLLEAAQAGLNQSTGVGAAFNLAQLIIPQGSSFDYSIQLVNPASQVFLFSGTYPEGQGGLDGDFNGDDVVDAADYAFWRNNSGTIEDYNLWRANYGNSASQIANSTIATPEPSAFAIAVIALAGCARRPSRCS